MKLINQAYEMEYIKNITDNNSLSFQITLPWHSYIVTEIKLKIPQRIRYIEMFQVLYIEDAWDGNPKTIPTPFNSERYKILFINRAEGIIWCLFPKDWKEANDKYQAEMRDRFGYYNGEI